MSRRTKRLIAMTGVLVAACVGFVLWHELWCGLRVTVVNRTPERHAFAVAYSGTSVTIDLAPGESRSMRLRAVAPPPAWDGTYASLHVQFDGPLPGSDVRGMGVGSPTRWGRIEFRTMSPRSDGDDRLCEVKADAPLNWARSLTRLIALQNPLMSETSAAISFRAAP